MVELTCETDFVAKTDKFIQGIETVLETFHSQKSLHIPYQNMGNQDFIDDLIKKTQLIRPLDGDLKSQTIEDGLKYVISKT